MKTTKATKAAPRKEIEELRHAGFFLANAAYNLAQTVVLEDHQRKSLTDAYKEWDAVQRAERSNP